MSWVRENHQRMNIFTLVLLVCFFMQASSSKLFAAYHDQSGDLPGMEDDSDVKHDVVKTLGIVAGVCVVVAGVTYLIMHSSPKPAVQNNTAPGNTEGTPAPDGIDKGDKVESPATQSLGFSWMWDNSNGGLTLPALLNLTYRF
jgi:hypothetical protein